MSKDDFVIDPHSLEKCRAITSPMVSVGILTYNQVNYISQAIESVLLQEVNFDYEIVIADDYSTDGTREIVQSYAEKYPDIIKLILQEENVGLVENSKCLKRKCKGRYRATQEGDDYWVDPLRLQKQVEFLENNPDYVAVCGTLSTVDKRGLACVMPWGGLKNNYVLEGEYNKENFERGLLPCHVGAWLSYNFFFVIDDETFNKYESYNNLPGDRKTPLFTLHYGKIMILPQIFMMRRILLDSKTSHISTFKNVSAPLRAFKWALEAMEMDRGFLKMELNMLPLMDKMFLSAFRELAIKPSKLAFAACLKIWLISPNKLHHTALFWTHFIAKLKKKIKSEGLFKAVKNGFKKAFKTLGKLLFGNR